MSVTSFVRSNRLLVAVLILSVLTLVLGLWLIQGYQTTASTAPADQSSAEQELLEQSLGVPSLPQLHQQPLNAEELQTLLQQLSHGLIPEDHGVSAEQIDAFLQEQTPGSENWCDLMLLKADDAWTDDDALVFAQHCI